MTLDFASQIIEFVIKVCIKSIKNSATFKGNGIILYKFELEIL